LFSFYLERIPNLSLQELSAGKINRGTKRFGGETGRGGIRGGGKREANGFALLCFSWLPATLTGQHSLIGPVALWQLALSVFFPPSSEQPCSFFFYWRLVIYATLFRVLFPGPERHGFWQFLLMVLNFSTLFVEFITIITLPITVFSTIPPQHWASVFYHYNSGPNTRSLSICY
jgi:hypothetical protein